MDTNDLSLANGQKARDDGPAPRPYTPEGISEASELERFAAIVESSSDAITCRGLDGTLRTWNKAAEKLYGYTAEEAIGQPASILVPPHLNHELVNLLERGRRGEAVPEHETVRMRKDGSLVDIAAAVFPVRDASGEIVGAAAIVRDITEKKRAQAEREQLLDTLRQQAERLQTQNQEAHRQQVELQALLAELNAVFTASSEPMVALDSRGVAVRANPALVALFGFNPVGMEAVDVGRRNLTRNSDGSEMEWKNRPSQRALRGETVIRETMLITNSTGQDSMVEESAAPVLSGGVRGAVITFHDITARWMADAELRQQKEEYRLLFDTVPSSVWHIGADFRVVKANRAAELALRLPPSGVTGKSIFEVFPPDVADVIKTEISRIMESGKGVFELVQTYIHPSGERRWRRTDAVPYRGPDGKVTGVLVFSQDITEAKQMEEQLARAERLETAGRVAGQVAHDFNNLLGPLAAYPELIRMRLEPNDPAQEFCRVMLQAVEQMSDMNEDMMALARRGHFNDEQVDLNELVRDILSRMQTPSITLSVEAQLAPNLLPISGSKAQLARVLTNLISNAREATQEIGSLTVTTENVYLERPLSRYTRVAAGEYVRVSVADTGCGIPDSIRDKIFDAFFSTKRMTSRRGCGLGLSVVHNIVEDHRGYIDLESEAGIGTTFQIYFPARRDLDQSQPSEKTLVGGHETILVVDDDPIQRQVMSSMLTTLGYTAKTAENGEEAVELLSQNAPALVILDMIMTGIDGAETYRQMKEINAGQRAIIVSGYSESDRVLEAQSLGAGAYVRKPLSLEDLARAVRGELDREF